MFESIRGHSILPSLLGPAPVVLDLGANHGLFSDLMHQRFGGRYYLAEANPVLARELSAAARFHVWHCAVAEKNGVIDFHVAANDEASSALASAPNDMGETAAAQKVTVAARTIESLIAEIPSPQIDLLKIDIEGMENPALLALSSETLQKIGQITVEFHCDERFGYNLRPEAKKTIRHLRANGFLFLNFSGTTLMDVLFVNHRHHHISYWKGCVWEWAGARPNWLRSLKRYVPENFRQSLNRNLDRIAGRKK